MTDNISVNQNSVHASLSFCVMIGTDQISETFFYNTRGWTESETG